MERNELIWGLMAVKKGQENIDLLAIAPSRRSCKAFLARGNHADLNHRTNLIEKNSLHELKVDHVSSSRNENQSWSIDIKRWKNTHRTFSECFYSFSRNNIMAAKIPRYILSRQQSASKHVVLFMLWYFMWKIGLRLKFSSLSVDWFLNPTDFEVKVKSTQLKVKFLIFPMLTTFSFF